MIEGSGLLIKSDEYPLEVEHSIECCGFEDGMKEVVTGGVFGALLMSWVSANWS
jgi:hypothetical protein